MRPARRAWLTVLLITLLSALGLTFAGSALASTVPAGTSTLALPAGSAVDADTGSVTVGVRFTASVNGQVDGVAFRKGTTVNTGRNVQLWDASTRSKLASSTFYTQSQLGTGLVYQPFTTPVAITAGHTYVASYLAPVGRYNSLNNAHTTAQTSGPLTAPVNAGVYTYGSTVAFPASSYQSSDYQVTPVFESTQPPPPVNQPPVASFTATPSGLAVSVDGSRSSDPDGTVAGYSWNWGDGSATGAGVTASHTYAAAGTYTVALTVTDNAGATGSSSQPVTVTSTPPPPPPTLMGWQLTSSNIGLAPFGLSCSALPTYSGSLTPAAGARISNVRITGNLDLSAGDIQISKSCIQPSSGDNRALVSNDICGANDCSVQSAVGVSITDSEFDASLSPASAIAESCAFRGIGDLERNYMHGMGSGICFFGTGNQLSGLAQQNFVTGLRAYGDPATTGSHNEAATVRDLVKNAANTRTAQFINNRLDCETGSDTGGLFIQPTWVDIYNITVQGNYLEGGGYNLYIENKGGVYGNLHSVDNRFRPTGWGPSTVASGVGWAEWSSNYLFDSTQPDSAGAVVTP